MKLSPALARGAPWLVALICPLLAHAPLWLLGLSADPFYFTSGLTESAARQILPGSPGMLDPNAGFTAAALGGFAARQWLSGVVPWWNPYAGVGLPLVAQPQPAALFLPFTLLLALKDGVLWNRMALQAVAGLATLGLLRELGVARRVALLGALLFELNGTFAWYADAPINPVAFLPLLLLGIARAARFARARRRGGWGWIAVALAGSLYAGFPETAYLDGLLALAWAGDRVLSAGAAAGRATAAKVALGGVIGLLLSAPATLPFLQALPGDAIGPHAAIGDEALPAATWVLLLAPYAHGPLGSTWQWAMAGGYLGLPLVWLAALAVARPGGGGRWTLAVWLLVALAKAAQAPGPAALFDLLPFIRQTAVHRYVIPSCEMACLLLACLAVQDWLDRGPPARPARAIATAVALGPLAVSLWLARDVIAPVARANALGAAYVIASLAAALCVWLGVARLIRRRPGGRAPLWLGALLVGYAALVFALPLLSGTRKLPIDRALVGFLREHLGLSRFYTLWPLWPNWGTPAGLATITYNAVPAPALWVDHVRAHLAPFADPIVFGPPRDTGSPGAESPTVALRRRLDAYAALGVAYVLAPSGTKLFAPLPDLRLAGGDGPGEPATLAPGAALAGEIPAGRVPSGEVTRASIDLPPGAAGTARLELCGWRACAGAVADARGALAFRFDPPLVINLGEPLSFRLTRGAAEAPLSVPLWPLAPGSAARAPGLALGFAPVPSLARVFRSPLADVFALPNPAPYVETRGAACALASIARESLTADCAAAAVLVRRELFDFGWRASVNGAAVPVTRTDDIFQSVSLPAGRSEILFPYAPPFIGWAVAGAALGLAGLGAGLWRGRRGG
jgi:hypothetical protein